MITNLLKYLYFLLFAIFVYLFFAGLVFSNIYINNDFIYLFSLLVIPVVDVVVEKVRMNVKLLIFIAIILFGYTFVFSLTGNQSLINLSLTFSYIFLVTGAITQYVGFIVDSKNKSLSVVKKIKKQDKGLDDYFYVFYIAVGILFLVGLFFEVFRFVFADYSFVKLSGVFLVFTLLLILSRQVKYNAKKTFKNKLGDIKYENFLKYRKDLNDNKLFKVLTQLHIRNDIVFYILFLILFVVFTFSYIYEVSNMIVLTYVFIFLTYIAFKIYGFKIENCIEKKDYKNKSFLITLISFSLLFAYSIYFLMEGYLLNDYKNLIISTATLMFLISFSSLFSNNNFSFRKKTITEEFIQVIKIHKVDKKKKIAPLLVGVLPVTIGAFYYVNNMAVNIQETAIIQEYNQNKIVNTDDLSYENKNTEISIIDETSTDSLLVENNDNEIINNELNTASDSLLVENNDSEIINNELNTASDLTKNKVKIGELYNFENYLSLYNESDDTLKLQEYLTKLGYYSGEINGVFDIGTRDALRNTLMYECHWPTSTKGVLGDNAAECIEGLEIEVE